jgi:hypothetical protein
MKLRVVAVTAAAIVTMSAARADAQTCLGTAPITNNMPLQVGALLAFSSGSTGIGAAATYGTDDFFGSVGIGRVSFDDLDASAPNFGITVGAQIPRDSERKLIVCPALNFVFVNGPKDVGGFDFSTRSFGGGATVGFVVSETDTLSLVPTAGLSINRVRVKGEFLGISDSVSDTIGQLGLGVGIIWNKVFSFVPAVIVPFGAEGADTAFQITVTYALGS